MIRRKIAAQHLAGSYHGRKCSQFVCPVYRRPLRTKFAQKSAVQADAFDEANCRRRYSLCRSLHQTKGKSRHSLRQVNIVAEYLKEVFAFYTKRAKGGVIPLPQTLDDRPPFRGYLSAAFLGVLCMPMPWIS